jgi:copper/silver efflux system protein
VNTRSVSRRLIVALAVPFSAVGAIWFLYALGYTMSLAVWVGLIALIGVDAETGVFMLLCLDLAYEKAKKAGRLMNREELARRSSKAPSSAGRNRRGSPFPVGIGKLPP